MGRQNSAVTLEDSLPVSCNVKYRLTIGPNNYTSVCFPSDLKLKSTQMLCGRLDGRGVGRRMDTCICMAEPLQCLPETVTTLFVNWLYPNAEKKTTYVHPKTVCRCL